MGNKNTNDSKRRYDLDKLTFTNESSVGKS